MQATPLLRDAVKKPLADPKLAKCQPLFFTYQESPSGIDSNLLILLHGIGDTHIPFQNLGKQLAGNLPQTAVLSLRGGSAIPFLENSWAYWPKWDDLGQEIPQPNLKSFLQSFQCLLTYLTLSADRGGCGWPSSAIHLLGFGQGATAALEGALSWSSSRTSENAKIQELESESSTSKERNLGSIVSICGEMISHPTSPLGLNTPVLMFDRHQSQSSQVTKMLKLTQRAFNNVTLASFPSSEIEIMPRNKAEWDRIMQFWGRCVRNRSTWEMDGQVYSVNEAKS